MPEYFGRRVVDLCVWVCVVILQILRASPELGCWRPVIQGRCVQLAYATA
jgi:hypothetical protein